MHLLAALALLVQDYSSYIDMATDVIQKILYML